MKIKHFLGLLLIGGVIGVIAYNVGANTNYLSSKQTTFTDLVSTNYHNQLKAPMRDAMINKLSHWAKNHEMRLQTYAQSTNYPHLTDDQLAFGSYLSTKNNNMLTAPMRDGLMGDFTNVITNHEMRIRCIQDGSCLKAQSTESPIGSGEAVLVVTNPLDMIFGADQIGPSYARALKVKGINIALQEDDPRLRYYSKNPNIIQPYGSDTVADFVPLTGGITQVCAYLMENGRKIEGCTVAVVGNGASSSGYSEYCEPRPEASCHNSSYENVDLACCAWSHNGYAGHTHIIPPQFNHTRCPSHAYMMGTVENGQFVEATWKNGQWSCCSVSFP